MKTLICIPCMDMVHTGFFKSMLGMRKLPGTTYTIRQCSLIYDARNQMAKQAIDEKYDRVMWVDSDMDFEPDLMERLSARLDEGLEFVTGLYFTRKAPIRPVLYKECGYFEIPQDDGRVAIKPVCDWFDEYPKDDLFKIQGCGFGAVMMTADLIKRVGDKFGAPFSPMLGFGEDLSFCARVQQVGGEMWCDSTIKLGHIGLAPFTEAVYLSQGGHHGTIGQGAVSLENLDKRI